MKVISAILLWAMTMLAWAEPIWIDVRSDAEYQQGHKQGALLMPHDAIAELIEETGIDRDAEIYLYCRSGRRAEQAKAVLQNLGYTQVTNLGGLQDALDKAGE